MAKLTGEHSAKHSNLSLSQQAKKFPAISAKLDDLRAALAERKTTWDHLSPKARLAWRANAKDQILSGAWTLFEDLAKFFEVELPQ